MSYNWNGLIQTSTTFAFSNQVAKKHAKRCRTIFCRRATTPFTLLKDKLAQTLSVKPAEILFHLI
jgi:hypothetical protein